MASVLPSNIPIPPTQSLVNYDYQDVADGTGVIVLYGCVSEDSSAAAYFLTRQAFYSRSIETFTINGAVTMTFDLTAFNISRIAKGTAYFSAGYKQTAGGASTTYSVQIKKWDGTTATNISSAIVSPTLAAAEQRMILIPIPLTETIIKVGEQLRMVVIATSNDANNAIGHDPQNRDGARVIPSTNPSVSTVMTLRMPFRIELT